ncbi:MAG: nuclear transport factor 2 family protein [Gemmatimonadota bacterium]
MTSDRMLLLDPRDGRVEEVRIPVQRANPRAVEVATNGDWWILLGAANKVARYRPTTKEWQTFDIGLYAHSIAIDSSGSVWYNGHFTKDPEVLGRIDPASGRVDTFDVPRHPTLATSPGGPVPYELRADPRGRIWMSELQGNRIVSFNPTTQQFTQHTMALDASAPRRIDIDARGIVWIPAYGANALVRLDPATGALRSYALPIKDAVPYVVRVDHATGHVWIGTSAADVLIGFDPTQGSFRSIPLPSRGAMVRHMAVDVTRGEVWLAYGASPGIPARVARVQVRRPDPEPASAARGGRATATADSAAIRAAALDYIEGWYGGDSVRMRRALHPDLAKRIVLPRADGSTRLSPNTTAEQLVAQTGEGGGKDTPTAAQRRDVRLLDQFGNAASVRIDARDWVDYLHLGKIDGRWLIVNVLWEQRPRESPRE